MTTICKSRFAFPHLSFLYLVQNLSSLSSAVIRSFLDRSSIADHGELIRPAITLLAVRDRFRSRVVSAALSLCSFGIRGSGAPTGKARESGYENEIAV